MSNAINLLKKELGIGARTNKFDIEFQNVPSAIKSNRNINILCKTVTLPSIELLEMDLYVQGRKLTIANQENNGGIITLTFYDTSSHKIRSFFTEWIHYIDNPSIDYRKTYNNWSYMSTVVIKQLDGNSKNTKEYTLTGCYPKQIEGITYSNENSNELVEVSVDFVFNDKSEDFDVFSLVSLAESFL